MDTLRKVFNLKFVSRKCDRQEIKGIINNEMFYK